MNLVYDPKRDILQISFSSNSVEETTQIAPGIVLDYDEDGRIIGLELRKASQKIADPYAIAFRVGQANSDKPQPKVKE